MEKTRKSSGAAGNPRRGAGTVLYGLFFFLCALSFSIFFYESGNWGRLTGEAGNLPALFEIGLVLLLILLFYAFRRIFLKNRRRTLLCIAAVLLPELYLHRMLFPFFLSGLYFWLLFFLFFLLFGEGKRVPLRELLRSASSLPGPDFLPLLFSLPLLLIQLNRMNIAADYDSLRYGLRSSYVLFNGDFFSALGQINAVYSYPKGLEILSFPLSHFRCFSLQLMFQFWTMIACAFLLFRILRLLGRAGRDSSYAVLFFFLMSSVGNMSITAKTDLITLLVQLAMLFFFLRGEWLKGTAALVLSYSFKPTAVVFSTASWLILMAGSLYLTLRSEGRAGFLREERRKGGAALLFSLLFTGLVTLRTLLITGLPFSTTFTGFFQAIGFQVKWPFNLDAHIDYATKGGAAELFLSVFRRALLFLFCPIGEDMNHVQIAWGGISIPILLFLSIRNMHHFRAGGRKGEGDEERRKRLFLLFLLLSGIGLLSLMTLSMLWQVDGNYYILLDSLLLLTAFAPIPDASSEDELPSLFKRREGEGGGRGGRLYLPGTAILYLASLFTTLITSWVGAVGFTPIDLLNRGYYDNVAMIKEFEAERGSLRHFSEMSLRKQNRVLAFARTPDCYYILCNVQSIADVEGSGGSPGLYDDPEFFEWFLKWADIDYIYLERSFLWDEREERAKEMLHSLLKDGMLYELDVEEGRADQDGFLLMKVDQQRLSYVWDGRELPALSESELSERREVFEHFLSGGFSYWEILEAKKKMGGAYR